MIKYLLTICCITISNLSVACMPNSLLLVASRVMEAQHTLPRVIARAYSHSTPEVFSAKYLDDLTKKKKNLGEKLQALDAQYQTACKESDDIFGIRASHYQLERKALIEEIERVDLALHD